MALTPGFKKFAGLVLTVALVAGGIYAFKSGAFKSNTPPERVEVEVAAPREAIELPQPIDSPISQAERVEEIAEQIDSPTPPPPQVGEQSAPSNSGMDALLNSSKK